MLSVLFLVVTLTAAPVPKNVPALLRCEDGSPVTDVAAWEGRRRGEIEAFFTREEYGRRPVDKPEGLTFTVVEHEVTNYTYFVVGYVLKHIRASWKGPKRDWSFDFLAMIPYAKAEPNKRHPAFLLICNRDPHENLDRMRVLKSPFWPAEEIVDRGYAAIAFWNGSLAPDDKSPVFTNGVYTCYADKRSQDSWGALSAWAWGASRVMDWIETDPTLDAQHVAVVGHSRGGKTALVAGVYDRRFAMVCSNDSGCSGAKLNHIELPKSEHIDVIAKAFPHWFSRRYAAWMGREDEMPYDQHEWLALVAPRLLCIGSASLDDWAGQLGEFYAAQYASPAWELYGLKGLVAPTVPPLQGDRPADGVVYQEGSISYHIRSGIHNLGTYDWHRYMDFADKHGWRR